MSPCRASLKPSEVGKNLRQVNISLAAYFVRLLLSSWSNCQLVIIYQKPDAKISKWPIKAKLWIVCMIDSLVNTYIIAEILQYIKKETWKQFVGIYTTGSNNPLSLAANFL